MRKKLLFLPFVAVFTLVAGLGFVFAETSFKDVSKNFWAYNTIQWAAERNIVKGFPDGTFKPNDKVTEQQFLTMLLRAYRTDFPEVTGPNWADPYYQFAVEMNYPVNGVDDLNKRNYVITREHVAEIIAGTQGVNYSGKDAIHYLLAKGLAMGKDPNNVSIESFGGNDPLTRAEAVQFVKTVLEKGIKDENGNPVLKPRPVEPSDPKALPPLPKKESNAKINPGSPWRSPEFEVDPTPLKRTKIEWGTLLDCSGEKCVEVKE